MSFYQTNAADFSEKVVQYFSGRRISEADVLGLFACKSQAELEAYMALPPNEKEAKQALTSAQYYEALDNLSEFIQACDGKVSIPNLEGLRTLQYNSIAYAKQKMPRVDRLRHPFRITALNNIIKAYDARHGVIRKGSEAYRDLLNENYGAYQTSLKEEWETRTQGEALRAEENAAYLATLPAEERRREEALQRAERAENEELNKLFRSAKEMLAKQRALEDTKKRAGFLHPSDEKKLKAYEAQALAAGTQLKERIAQLATRAKLLSQSGQISRERCEARLAQLQSGDLSYSLYQSDAARQAAGQLSGAELNDVTLSRLEGRAHEEFKNTISSIANDEFSRTGSFFSLPAEQTAALDADIAKLSPADAAIALAYVEQNGITKDESGPARFLPPTHKEIARYRAKANAAYLAALSPDERKAEEALQKRERKENAELEKLYNDIKKARRDFLAASGRKFESIKKKEAALRERLDARVSQLMVRATLEKSLGLITPERYEARIQQLQNGDFTYSLYNSTEARLAAGQNSLQDTVYKVAPLSAPDHNKLKEKYEIVERYSAMNPRGADGMVATMAELQKLSPDLQKLALSRIDRKGIDPKAQGIARCLNLSKKDIQAYTDRYNAMIAEQYPGLYGKHVMMTTPEAVAAELAEGKLPTALCSEAEIKATFDAGFTKLQERIKLVTGYAMDHPSTEANLFLTEAQRADFFAVGLNTMMERFFRAENVPESEIDLPAILAAEDDYEFMLALFAKSPIANYVGVQYQERGATQTERKAFQDRHRETIKAAIAKVDLEKYVTSRRPDRTQAALYGAFLRSYQFSAQTTKFEEIIAAHEQAEQEKAQLREAEAQGKTLTEEERNVLSRPTPLESYVEKQVKGYFAQQVAEQRDMIKRETKSYVAAAVTGKPMDKDRMVKSLLSLKKDTSGNLEFHGEDLPKFMESEESARAYLDQLDLYIQENQVALRNQVEYDKMCTKLDAAENEARGTNGLPDEEIARLRAVYEKTKTEFTTYQAAYQADPSNKINTTTQVYRDLSAMEAVPALQTRRQLDLSAHLHTTAKQATTASVAPATPVAERQVPTQDEIR